MYPSFPPASLSHPKGMKKEEEEEFECSPKDSTVVAFFFHAAQGKIATLAHFRSQRGGERRGCVWTKQKPSLSLSPEGAFDQMQAQGKSKPASSWCRRREIRRITTFF